MKTNNVIPRQFIKITGKMLIKTSCDEIGDIVTVTRNEYNQLTEVNHRTGERACPFISMLRNAQIFELLEVVK